VYLSPNVLEKKVVEDGCFKYSVIEHDHVRYHYDISGIDVLYIIQFNMNHLTIMCEPADFFALKDDPRLIQLEDYLLNAYADMILETPSFRLRYITGDYQLKRWEK